MSCQPCTAQPPANYACSAVQAGEWLGKPETVHSLPILQLGGAMVPGLGQFAPRLLGVLISYQMVHACMRWSWGRCSGSGTASMQARTAHHALPPLALSTLPEQPAHPQLFGRSCWGWACAESNWPCGHANVRAHGACGMAMGALPPFLPLRWRARQELHAHTPGHLRELAPLLPAQLLPSGATRKRKRRRTRGLTTSNQPGEATAQSHSEVSPRALHGPPI